MRIGLLAKDRAEKVFVAIHNNETGTADMLLGEPVTFVMSGTEDGNLAQKLTSSTLVPAHAFIAGVVGSNDTTPSAAIGLAPGNYGIAQVYGLCQRTIVVRQTRPTTTDSWASVPAIVAGDIYQLLTGANALSRSASGAGLTNGVNFAVAVDTAVSLASSASTSSETRTAVTLGLKTFLRLM